MQWICPSSDESVLAPICGSMPPHEWPVWPCSLRVWVHTPTSKHLSMGCTSFCQSNSLVPCRTASPTHLLDSPNTEGKWRFGHTSHMDSWSQELIQEEKDNSNSPSLIYVVTWRFPCSEINNYQDAGTLSTLMCTLTRHVYTAKVRNLLNSKHFETGIWILSDGCSFF